jgi:uncharacterized RDD family membrane protein YckC
MPKPIDPFASYACELLSGLGPCVARRMFGGWGISVDGMNIGIIAWELLAGLALGAATIWWFARSVRSRTRARALATIGLTMIVVQFVGGFLAIGGAVLVVMFLYQTATIAFMGRTFGMKLFSIEIIDAEANELPTLHQAAVNSAVYLLSLLLGGIGFLPALFNEERRTIHDMLSGTILIREY